MRICPDHWARLRAAISERGLDHLIAPDAEAAVRQVKDGLERGRSTIANFDPLMYANFAISEQAIKAGGLGMLTANEDGSPRCPICFLSAAHDEFCTLPECELPKDGTAFDGWIDHAANDAKSMADKLLAEA